MGFYRTKPFQCAIIIAERFEFSISILRAEKTIILHGSDIENTLENTSVMAAKGVSSTSATYYPADNSNMTNYAKNKYALPPEGRNFSVCPNLQGRFKL